MKPLLTAILAVALAPGLAFAQAGAIGIFTDPGATSYLLEDRTVGLALYYVVHVYTGGATGSEWAAPKPACHAGMWLSDQNQFAVVLGNTQTGYSVGYGSCRTGTIHVCTMQFFNMGLTTACCFWPVVPHPTNANGRIEGSDCNFELILPSGGTSVVNPDPTCTDPVEDMTWGGVKALFVE